MSPTRTYTCRFQNYVPSPPFITTFSDPIVSPKHIPKWRKRNIHTNLCCIWCEQNERNSNSEKNTETHCNKRLNSVIVRCDFIRRISKSPLSARFEDVSVISSNHQVGRGGGNASPDEFEPEIASNRKIEVLLIAFLVILVVATVSMSPNVAAYPTSYSANYSQPGVYYGNSTGPNQCYGYGGYGCGGYSRCYYSSCGYGNGCYYNSGYYNYGSYCGSNYNGYNNGNNYQTTATTTQTVYSTATSYVTSFVTLPVVTTTTTITSVTTVLDETAATIAGISALALALILVIVAFSLAGARRAYNDLQQRQIQQQTRTTTQTPQAAQIGYCGVCGSPIQVGHAFCSKCGTRFTGSTQLWSNRVQQSPWRGLETRPKHPEQNSGVGEQLNP